ncbi:hypothetical protein [Mesorhizobium ventifaucium]|uniref:hypothetical protein n=1 Tax=Mesorhizobium ventifaucium TaxID=666020 RepID=UPI003F53B25D
MNTFIGFSEVSPASSMSSSVPRGAGRPFCDGIIFCFLCFRSKHEYTASQEKQSPWELFFWLRDKLSTSQGLFSAANQSDPIAFNQRLAGWVDRATILLRLQPVAVLMTPPIRRHNANRLPFGQAFQLGDGMAAEARRGWNLQLPIAMCGRIDAVKGGNRWRAICSSS